jgi:hypothetical protein
MRSTSYGVFSHLEIEKPEVWRAPSSCLPSRNCLEPVVSFLSFTVLASENNLQRFWSTIYPQTVIIWFSFHHPECALLCLFPSNPLRNTHVLTRIYTIQRPTGVLYCIFIAGVERRVPQGFPVLNLTRNLPCGRQAR